MLNLIYGIKVAIFYHSNR